MPKHEHPLIGLRCPEEVPGSLQGCQSATTYRHVADYPVLFRDFLKYTEAQKQECGWMSRKLASTRLSSSIPHSNNGSFATICRLLMHPTDPFLSYDTKRNCIQVWALPNTSPSRWGKLHLQDWKLWWSMLVPNWHIFEFLFFYDVLPNLCQLLPMMLCWTFSACFELTMYYEYCSMLLSIQVDSRAGLCYLPGMLFYRNVHYAFSQIRLDFLFQVTSSWLSGFLMSL